MSERQLLDLLARDAPVAPDDCADRVVEAAHRRSRNRAIAVSCAIVAAIAVVPLAALEHDNRAGRPAAGQTAVRTAVPTGSASHPAPHYSAAAQVYAAAVATIVGRAAPAQDAHRIYVYDTTVPGVVTDPGSTRPGKLLPAPLRAEIVALLLPRRAEFVRPGAHLRADDGPLPDGTVVVTLGDATVGGDSARVPIAASCGPLCGRGQTLTLRLVNGTWTVTGTTGPEWIS
jgi:hypothetical protein